MTRARRALSHCGALRPRALHPAQTKTSGSTVALSHRILRAYRPETADAAPRTRSDPARLSPRSPADSARMFLSHFSRQRSPTRRRRNFADCRDRFCRSAFRCSASPERKMSGEHGGELRTRARPTRWQGASELSRSNERARITCGNTNAVSTNTDAR